MNQRNAIALRQSPQFAAPNFLAYAALINKQRERADREDVVARAPVDRRMDARLPSARSDVAIEDWDDLFRAVTTRLTLTFDKPHASTVSARLRAVALECVEALEQLRTTMTHELCRLQQTNGQIDRTAVSQAGAARRP
jgi:hypothetical protein